MPRVLRDPAAIVAGGFLGAIVRAGVAEALPISPGSWPWATLLVNLAGAFGLAFVVARLAGSAGPWGPLLGTGLCGALTTFSTVQVELLGMLDAGARGLAAAYAAVSLACGLAVVALATELGRRQVEAR